MSTDSRVRIRMPEHSRADRRQSEAPDEKRDVRMIYGLPQPSDLSQPGVLGSYMDRLLAADQKADAAYRQLLRAGIAMRYQHALDLKNDPEAFAAWQQEPRIRGLPRPPKKKEDICRALFRATYLNPSDASKRFKRIEFAWKKAEPVEVVAAFLAKRGLQDTKPASGAKEEDEDKLNERETVGESDGGDNDASDDDDGDVCEDVADAGAHHRRGARIVNAPTALVAAKKVGDFVCLGGYIESIDGGGFVLRDMWHG